MTNPLTNKLPEGEKIVTSNTILGNSDLETSFRDRELYLPTL